MQEFKPILSFICFFQSDRQLTDKIGSACSMFTFTNISPYTCATTQYLFRQYMHFLTFCKMLIEFHDSHSKVKA